MQVHICMIHCFLLVIIKSLAHLFIFADHLEDSQVDCKCSSHHACTIQQHIHIEPVHKPLPMKHRIQRNKGMSSLMLSFISHPHPSPDSCEWYTHSLLTFTDNIPSMIDHDDNNNIYAPLHTQLFSSRHSPPMTHRKDIDDDMDVDRTIKSSSLGKCPARVSVSTAGDPSPPHHMFTSIYFSRPPHPFITLIFPYRLCTQAWLHWYPTCCFYTHLSLYFLPMPSAPS